MCPARAQSIGLKSRTQLVLKHKALRGLKANRGNYTHGRSDWQYLACLFFRSYAGTCPVRGCSFIVNDLGIDLKVTSTFIM